MYLTINYIWLRILLCFAESSLEHFQGDHLGRLRECLGSFGWPCRWCGEDRTTQKGVGRNRAKNAPQRLLEFLQEYNALTTVLRQAFGVVSTASHG